MGLMKNNAGHGPDLNSADRGIPATAQRMAE
jgi:hypothetical protein